MSKIINKISGAKFEHISKQLQFKICGDLIVRLSDLISVKPKTEGFEWCQFEFILNIKEEIINDLERKYPSLLFQRPSANQPYLCVTLKSNDIIDHEIGREEDDDFYKNNN